MGFGVICPKWSQSRQTAGQACVLRFHELGWQDCSVKKISPTAPFRANYGFISSCFGPSSRQAKCAR